MRKIFNLSVEEETLKALSRLAARRQLEQGGKVSVTQIINEAVADYLKHNDSSS